MARVVIGVLLVLVVGGGIWLQSRDDSGELPTTIPVVQPAADYPVQAPGGVVLAGEPDAPVTIDVYEDFLCPICGDFEDEYGDRLARAAASGAATVRYHPVAILDRRSDPPGYSTLAAATALCAADARIYPVVHASLFASQPEEGGTGWTQAQLLQLGRDVGAGEDFTRCLREDGAQRTAAATQQAQLDVSGLQGLSGPQALTGLQGLSSPQALSDPQGLGVPTVLVNGKVADFGDSDWFDHVLSTSGG
ncbi:MAG: DsbA family protein [Actinomycetota bacterium]|nr:DsbA family protein [Actinomycetota bacterium]